MRIAKKIIDLFHRHRFILAVFSVLFLFFFASASLVVANGESVGPSDSRVVSIFDKGEETVVPTRAATVKELLSKLDVTLHEKDLVEPALETPILEDNFRINIYRARPVAVIEGDKQVTVLTPHNSPRLIAQDAGISLYPEDSADFKQPDTILGDGVLGEEMVITRATPVTINLYGNLIVDRTQKTTVGDVLKEKGIKLAEGDTMQPQDPKTRILPNMIISLNRFGKQVVTVEEAIPFEVQSSTDPSIQIGKIVVQIPGVPGKRIATYELELKNGKEVGRKLLQSVVAANPSTQIQVKGAKITNISDNVTLGQQMAAASGWTGDEWVCLYQLWDRESHWNHLAGNRNTGAYGIPQALPGSKMGAGWEYDPAVQIRWGIGYIKGKYGTACRAWSFWQTNHWY